MSRYKNLLEEIQICEGFLPVDTQTADNTGDWVSLANYGKCLVVFFKALGTANDDPVIDLNQATTSAGGGPSKGLNFTTLYTKQAATNLQSTGQWTKVTQTAAASYTFNGTSAEQALLAVIDVDARDLDVDNDFKFLRADVADTGAAGAQLGALMYILYNPRHSLAPASMVSALA